LDRSRIADHPGVISPGGSKRVRDHADGNRGSTLWQTNGNAISSQVTNIDPVSL
jgi:hypothetical protein